MRTPSVEEFREASRRFGEPAAWEEQDCRGGYWYAEEYLLRERKICPVGRALKFVPDERSDERATEP